MPPGQPDIYAEHLSLSDRLAVNFGKLLYKKPDCHHTMDKTISSYDKAKKKKIAFNYSHTHTHTNTPLVAER